MNGFLSLLASTLFLSSFASSAEAGGVIGPGERIPVDLTKASVPGKIKQVVDSCLYDETLASLLPAMVGVQPKAGTQPDIRSDGDTEDDRTGNDIDWKTTAVWFPKKSNDMEFVEPQTAESRTFSLWTSTSRNYISTLTTIGASLDTDFGGTPVSVSLSLEGGLPQVEVTSTGHRTCAVDNWGNEVCSDSEAVTSVDVVIPTEFISGDFWVNERTGNKTQKYFNYFGYAECLIWGLEN